MFRRTFMRLLAGVPALPQALAAVAPVTRVFYMNRGVANQLRAVTVRTGLPPLKWRKLHEGVSLTKTFTERNPLLDELFTDERSHR